MRMKNLRGVSEVRFEKNWTPSLLKRRKTTLSATFCATGVWGLTFDSLFIHIYLPSLRYLFKVRLDSLDEIGSPVPGSCDEVVTKQMTEELREIVRSVWGTSFKTTAKILKSGKILSCYFFANSSPYYDIWLSCLSRATTPHPSRFSKSSWYFKKTLFEEIWLLNNFIFIIIQNSKIELGWSWVRNFCQSSSTPNFTWYFQKYVFLIIAMIELLFDNI